MAVNTIAGAAPRQTISELRLPWVWAFLATIAMVGSLGVVYVRNAEQISAARSEVLRFEAQLRSEQARGDSLKADIAKMQTMESLTTAANLQLQMREASSQGVAYVPAPDYIARNSSAYSGPGTNGRIVSASLLVERPGHLVAGRDRGVGVVTPPTNWLERIVAAFAPAPVSASEGDAQR